MPLNSKRILLLAALVLTCCSLLAVGEIIYDIRVTGNRNVETSLVLSAISLRVGDSLDPEEVSKSIKNLNNLSVFSDIQVESEPYRNGVNLIFRISEYPIVEDVNYEGFKVLKKDAIGELITLRKGSYWSPQLKNQVIRKLEKEYLSKGYQYAKISVREKARENNRVAVTLSCDEGKRVAIREIIFIGNEHLERNKLLKRMSTKSASLLRAGRYDQEKFELDLTKIISYYNKNGFIDARIINWEVVPLDEKSLKMEITLEEGIKYRFGEIEVTGNEKFTSETILSQFTLKSGESFDQEKFDQQLRKVYSLYFDEGYIYANIEPEKNKAGDLLNVILIVKEGNRAKIRQIHIGGNRRTKDKVIRRQLEVAPGDYYRQSQIMRTRQNIYNLGFFEPDIGFDYTPINNDGDIDLQIEVIDKSSGSANGGVGYNSQDKFIGQLSVSQNNLFGNNWSAGVKWEFGGNTQNFEFDFTNPNFYDTDILAGFNLYHTRKKWSSFNYEIFTQGAGIRAGQPFPLINRSRIVLGYSLYSKKYRITDMAAVMQNPAQNQNLIELDSLGWRYTSSVNATFNRDTRNNIFFPTSGSQFTLYSEVAGGPIGGDFDYFKQIAQINWYMETWYNLALRTKWRFGYATHYGRSRDVPPDEKFYLGGTGPDGIRGYPDRSISPIGGGTRAIIFSTEVGYPIGGDQVIGLGFFDAGNSFNKLRDFNFLDLKKGVGLGIRIRSPFGLIGFDYAYNLQNDTWEPHLQFGTTF